MKIESSRTEVEEGLCLKSMADWLVSRRLLQAKDLHHDFIVENIIGDQKVSLVKRQYFYARQQELL